MTITSYLKYAPNEQLVLKNRVKTLVAAQIIEPAAVRTVRSGFAEIGIYKLTAATQKWMHEDEE